MVNMIAVVDGEPNLDSGLYQTIAKLLIGTDDATFAISIDVIDIAYPGDPLAGSERINAQGSCNDPGVVCLTHPLNWYEK
jgi:hypothetical protein